MAWFSMSKHDLFRSSALWGAVVVMLTAAGPALGQASGFPWNLFGGGTTGSVRPAPPAAASPTAPPAAAVPAPAAPGAPPEWSGESGASGHPTMTAAAIRAAAANFRQCLAGLWPLAAQRGVSRSLYEAQT